jgi:site-specific recombinase XerC
MVQYRVLRASRRAKLSQDGVHILRHTFCSHLAMQGAPPRAIQELAGHRELGVTQRYMHLSPAALDSAIRLLDQPSVLQSLETWGRRDDPRRKDQWLEQFNWR